MRTDQSNRESVHALNTKHYWNDAFGFIIKRKKKHDLAVHPKFPQLRGTLTRSSGEIHRHYVDHAVKLIEKLLYLEGDENEQ